MPNKPKPRSLSAEPLEERLPVSGSIAGVLFGYGLASDISFAQQTAHYESPARYESPAQQSPLEIFELNPLDLQLDAMAVDLVHGEGLLLDTISSAGDDPFVLTPLTPGDALSDVVNDPHRERGDELLLFQISTLDFAPMGGATYGLGDALFSLGYSTGYGDLPTSNIGDFTNVKKDNETIPQSPSRGSQDPFVSVLTLSTTCACGGHGDGAVYIEDDGYSEHSNDDVIYVIQTGDTVTVAATLQSEALGLTEYGTIELTSDLTEEEAGYWTTTTTTMTYQLGVKHQNILQKTFTWTKPANVLNKDVKDRLFEFTFSPPHSGATPFTWMVYIGYVEVEVQFAGEGGFRPLRVEGDKSDQSAENTVVIGQKVEAKIAHDPNFPLTDPSLLRWEHPLGGGVVKNYTTNDTIGKVTKLDMFNQEGNFNAHYKQQEFDYYYTSKVYEVGSISYGDGRCSVTDPNGLKHYLDPKASFYIEAPTVAPGAFSSVFASWNPAENPVGVRESRIKDPNDDVLCLILGGTPEGKDTKAGITWTANVVAPPVIGGGHIAYSQLVRKDVSRYFQYGNPIIKEKSEGLGYMLDNRFPYGGNEYIFSVDRELKCNDSPNTPLQTSAIADISDINYIRQDSFETYLIYKPAGKSTIWVTLSMISWGWIGITEWNTIFNTAPNTWELVLGNVTGGGNGTPPSHLPEWDKNVKDYKLPTPWVKIN